MNIYIEYQNKTYQIFIRKLNDIADSIFDMKTLVKNLDYKFFSLTNCACFLSLSLSPSLVVGPLITCNEPSSY